MTTETLMSDAAVTNEGTSASTTANASTQTAAPGADTNVDATATTQQSTEGQANDTTQNAGEDGQAAGETQDAPAGAPEKYEFVVPEGVNVDAAVIDNLSEVARELNLPQAEAQKILNKMGPALQAQQVEAIKQVQTQWVADSQADKEFGGEKLTENLAVAKKALDQFGSPELRTLLNATGLGNNPEIIRAFYRAGKAISEDSFVGGSKGQPKSGSRDYAKELYPNQQN